MKIQIVLLILCFTTVLTLAEDSKTLKYDREIQEILKKGGEELKKLNHEVRDLANLQKGIEDKIKKQLDQVKGITRLEEDLVKLQNDTAHSFQLTASGVKNLTASIRSFEVKNNEALQNLNKSELQIKEVIVKVDANQNIHKNELKNVSKTVEKHLKDLSNSLKESISRELVSLEKTAKTMKLTQKNIDYKVLHLSELSDLTGRANYKVDELEQSLQLVNNTQTQRLADISQYVLKVDVGAEHLSKKLVQLLSNQKSIEKNLNDCTKYKNPSQQTDLKNIWAPAQSAYDPNFW
ncbi:uncharacterized protein MCAP_0864-like [Drosophila tropicalis]|uniref:uncharacterized protein MCAP_0864-like n=1 Tax=Drosophila tropicalis TaxID=46794 RepID=UPI0035AB73D2